jgi:hypothetical protein
MDDRHVARCNVRSSGLASVRTIKELIAYSKIGRQIVIRKTVGTSQFHDSTKKRYTPLHARPLGVPFSHTHHRAISHTRPTLPVIVKRDLMQVRSACRLRCPDKVCLMGNDVEASAGGRWTRWLVVLAVICVQRLSMFACAVGHASGLREKACVLMVTALSSRAQHNIIKVHINQARACRGRYITIPAFSLNAGSSLSYARMLRCSQL